RRNALAFRPARQGVASPNGSDIPTGCVEEGLRDMPDDPTDLANRLRELPGALPPAEDLFAPTLDPPGTGEDDDAPAGLAPTFRPPLGAPPPPGPGPLPAPGQRLDDFELLGVLGTGAFARVYLARQSSLGRLVALKVSAHCGDEARTLAS